MSIRNWGNNHRVYECILIDWEPGVYNRKYLWNTQVLSLRV